MTPPVRGALIQTTAHGRMLVREAARPRGLLAGFHGYGEDAEAQMTRLESIAGLEAWTLASIQGLHRFYRGRSEQVVSSWMVRQDREALIADNIAYVDAALTTLATPDGVPIVFAGFSQGVAMAFRAAVRGSRAGAGVIGVGGDVPPELLADAAAGFPPVLLMRGSREDWYTEEKLRHDVAALERRGTQVAVVTYEGGHEWTDQVSAAAADFIASCAPGSRRDSKDRPV